MSPKSVTLWRFLTSEKPILLEPVTAPFTNGCFSRDDRYLATSHRDGTISIWDATEGQRVRTYSWNIGPLEAVAFAPDGLTCAAGGSEGRIVLWDIDE
jgi:WD40 repeat protein